jgi:predicted regulator of Ras-like GTPase activity (Roadblock/LC7/MglB family)
MTEKGFRKEFKVEAENLAEKVKELIREGNIRRVIVKGQDGKTLLDLPLTIGVVGALLAPQLAALGAIAALVSQATLVVEYDPEKPEPQVRDA